MEGRRRESGPRPPEYSKAQIMDFMKDYLDYREKERDEQTARAESKADEIRRERLQKGTNMETMKKMVEVLEETGYEAFSPAELNQIISALDYVILEVDPAFKQFYRDLKQRLTGIVRIKIDYERLKEAEDQVRREKRRRENQ